MKTMHILFVIFIIWLCSNVFCVKDSDSDTDVDMVREVHAENIHPHSDSVHGCCCCCCCSADHSHLGPDQMEMH